MREKCVGERLEPTLKHARAELMRYEAKCELLPLLARPTF